MKKFAILFAVCAMAIIFSSQDATAQHCRGGHGYRHGHGHRHHGGYYGGNRSSFAIAVGGPNAAFAYGNGFYGGPYGGWGVPVAPVAPVVPVYGGYPGYGWGGGWGGGCRGGGGGGVFIGW